MMAACKLFHIQCHSSGSLALSQTLRNPHTSLRRVSALFFTTKTAPLPPHTIQWHDNISNMVSLIGLLASDIELKRLHTGSVVARSPLAVENKSIKSANPYMWFLLEFWDDMAHIAAKYLKKGEQIFVCGSFGWQQFTNEDNVQKLAYKVIVDDVKLVEGMLDKKWNPDKDIPEWMSGELGKLLRNEHEKEGEKIVNLWQSYLDNTANWLDCRENKLSPTHPDFKHKKTRECLWISRSTPEWVKEKLAKLGSRNEDENEGGRIEKLWRTYFDNPSDWWDNREKKVNPKYPDFKQKKTEEALWIDSKKTPEWVKEKLANMESNKQYQKEDTRNHETSLTRLWESLFANPSEWSDNRDTKKNAGAPDFKHKSTGEALWIDHYKNPDWVIPQLAILDSSAEARENQAEAGDSSAHFGEDHAEAAA